MYLIRSESQLVIEIRSLRNMPYLILSFSGVYIALKGAHITNNSNINIRNIGQTSDNPNGALQCITDHLYCCSQTNSRRGEWYLPNGALVQGMSSTTAFYRNRGANGEVSLNRPGGVESPTGLFCCEVSDATNTNQALCVNIGMLQKPCTVKVTCYSVLGLTIANHINIILYQ